MCYGKPDEILRNVLEARPLESDSLGHTVLDDFEHFCAYSITLARGTMETEIVKQQAWLLADESNAAIGGLAIKPEQNVSTRRISLKARSG